MRNWHFTLLYKNLCLWIAAGADGGGWKKLLLFVMLLTLSSVLYTYVMCLNNAFRLGCQFFGCRTPKYICNPFFSKIKCLQEKIFVIFLFLR
jgi:hypothetical protein